MSRPIRYKANNLDFPKDENSRPFAIIHDIGKLLNGERHDRIWLVYSKKLGTIICFCCNFVLNLYLNFQLVNDGSNDWKNLSAGLKHEETSNEHIINMTAG